jgi:hypothetical protein
MEDLTGDSVKAPGASPMPKAQVTWMSTPYTWAPAQMSTAGGSSFVTLTPNCRSTDSSDTPEGVRRAINFFVAQHIFTNTSGCLRVIRPGSRSFGSIIRTAVSPDSHLSNGLHISLVLVGTGRSEGFILDMKPGFQAAQPLGES